MVDWESSFNIPCRKSWQKLKSMLTFVLDWLLPVIYMIHWKATFALTFYIDDCPSNPLQMYPGTCICGIADADTYIDWTKADCKDWCPCHAKKTAVSLYGCCTDNQIPTVMAYPTLTIVAGKIPTRDVWRFVVVVASPIWSNIDMAKMPDCKVVVQKMQTILTHSKWCCRNWLGQCCCAQLHYMQKWCQEDYYW